MAPQPLVFDGLAITTVRLQGGSIPELELLIMGKHAIPEEGDILELSLQVIVQGRGTHKSWDVKQRKDDGTWTLPHGVKSRILRVSGKVVPGSSSITGLLTRDQWDPQAKFEEMQVDEETNA